MKVLFVVYRDNERSGGGVRVAEVLASSLLKHGLDIYVVCAYGGVGRLKASLGDRCVLMAAKDRNDFRAWLRYRRFVKELMPDIVHFVDGVGWMTLAGLGLEPKRVIHQHFRPGVGPEGVKRLPLIRLLSGTADHVIAISEGARRQLAEKCRIPNAKVSVVYNSIDPAYLRVADGSKSVKSSEPGNRVLGMAVRVVEDKGIEDAFNLLQVLPDNYTLKIAGDGPARPALEARSVLLGLDQRIRWMGSVRDVSAFYQSIDYYLFMSWYEGFGLSVAEAMYCHKPVVGLLGDGEIAEPEYPLVTAENSLLIDRSEPGTFGPEADPEVIARLAKELLALDANITARNAMIENAVEWVETRFSSSVQAQKIIDVYSRVLSSGSCFPV